MLGTKSRSVRDTVEAQEPAGKHSPCISEEQMRHEHVHRVVYEMGRIRNGMG